MKWKISNKEKVLKKSPKVYAVEKDGAWEIHLPTKSGIHRIGSGATEDGAWQSAVKFYNL